MGASTDEIDRQIKETREHMDENLGVLEQRAAVNVRRYGRIAAAFLGAAVLAGAGVLIYRRLNRRSRRERLQNMVIQALKDLPDSLRDMPDEVARKLKKPLPSIKVVVNGAESNEPGTLRTMVGRVAPAVVSTASSAWIRRPRRSSDRAEADSAHG